MSTLSSRAATPRRPSGMTLAELVCELGRARASLDCGGRDAGLVRVSDVRHDSRQVRPGDLFVALPGTHSDGLRFLGDAVASGATAAIVPTESPSTEQRVPLIRAGDVRLAMALASEAVHGWPSHSLDVVGITGTNGKTTTVALLAQALEGLGRRPARLGTLGYSFDGNQLDGSLTTPEADDISRYLAAVTREGATHAVMEVSSHALAQARVDALRLTAAAFANLTQDHLDFHGTMEAYFAAKRRLFVDLAPDVAVINVDDPMGAELANASESKRVLRVSRNPSAEVSASAVEMSASGISATVTLPSGKVQLETRLVGDHNLDNLLMSLALVEALELDIAAAAEALSRVPPVPGRLEPCETTDDDLCVLVDYAHTPDALRRALQAVRSLTHGAVICVFGCGGDRDATKRPLMGEAVGHAADRALLTTDNPRTEDPAAITRDVEPGLRKTRIAYEVVLDRETAIHRAVAEASAGDVVLIAGKGHEPYQIVGTVSRPFDDRAVARAALSARRHRRGT